MPSIKRTSGLNEAPEVLRQELNKLIADVAELRTNLIAALVQLDDDAGVTGADFEATHTPAAMTAEAVTITRPTSI